MYYVHVADCSQALQDPNCANCGFDANGMPICTVCISGYEATGGICEREGRIYVSIISQRNLVAFPFLFLSPSSSSMQISCVIISGVVLVSI